MQSPLLVLTIPLSMVALTLSSVPVHLNYFKSLDINSSTSHALSKQYISSLTWVSIISFAILSLTLTILPGENDAYFISLVGITFLIEKLCDESSRFLEFQKKFVNWFYVQTLRSGWFLAAQALSFSTLPYKENLILCAAIALLISLYVFSRVSKLTFCFNLTGVHLITNNLVFWFGNFLPTIYVQVPRIIVPILFPNGAHIFFALSQIAQGVGLLFNVKFIIPYRKVIARHTKLFHDRIFRVKLVTMLVCFIVATAYIYFGLSLDNSPSQAYLVLGLSPIVLADALTLSVLSAYLGYIPWIGNMTLSAKYYWTCLISAILTAAAIYFSSLFEILSIYNILGFSICLGLIWALLAYSWFFVTREHI